MLKSAQNSKGTNNTHTYRKSVIDNISGSWRQSKALRWRFYYFYSYMCKFLFFEFQIQIVGHVSICLNSQWTSMLDHELAQMDQLEITHNQYLNATRNAYSNNLSCERVQVTYSTPLQNRTLCPWEFVEDIDVNRFPPVLTMAKCTCARCFDNYTCKPVLYSIHVLQKQCIDGVNKWVRRPQLISVACTCSRPVMMQVKKKRLSDLFKISSYYRNMKIPSIRPGKWINGCLKRTALQIMCSKKRHFCWDFNFQISRT